MKESRPEDFPVQSPAGEIGYGDMIRYRSNGVEVCIYARRVFNGWIVDGNVMCDIQSVVKIEIKGAWQKL